MLFPKALFLAGTFPKLVRNYIFLLNLYQKFPDFLKILQQFVIFDQTRENITHGLLPFLKNMLK